MNTSEISTGKNMTGQQFASHIATVPAQLSAGSAFAWVKAKFHFAQAKGLILTPAKAEPSPNNESTNPNRVLNPVRVQMPDRPLCHPERPLCHPERSRRISSLLA